MKRFIVIPAAAALAALLWNSSWSYGSQGGGGAGGAGAAGAAGASGTAGAAGVSGAAGAPGTAGAAGNVGTAGTGVGTGQNPVGANAQLNRNFDGISATPFFADPGVRVLSYERFFSSWV